MFKLSALGGAFLALLGVRLLQPAAELLFAAHMGQHLLLMGIAAPLLVLAGLEIRIPPLAGWGLFIAIFLFWHWPTFFRWAAREPFGELPELGSIWLPPAASGAGCWSPVASTTVPAL